MGLNSNFQFYSDYFAYVLESGLNRARTIYPAISNSSSVDITTISRRQLSNANLAKSSFSRSLDLAYESLWQEGHSIASFQESFRALSDYVLDKTGQEIEDFLTSEGIKVQPLYATLANAFGEDISDDNIEAN